MILAFGMPAAPEWIFIGILALVLFGPKKLPELARGFGKAMGELQKAKEDFQREITGVPPLPKIESQSGLQSTALSEGSADPLPSREANAAEASTSQAPETLESKNSVSPSHQSSSSTLNS
jgi:sec-independent protein translocase protein TatA